MTAVAIRHPERGKAHREHDCEWDCRFTQCRKRAFAMTNHTPLADGAPEDRCRRCWPEEVGS